MTSIYFNFTTRTAGNRWDRRVFVQKWRRIYARDPYWVPPYYPVLRRELEPARNSHLAHMDPVLLYTEAFSRGERNPLALNYSLSRDMAVNEPLFEKPVAAAVVLFDARRQDGVAYLSLLHCVNDAESLERLAEQVSSLLIEKGYSRLVGPTGLSPLLGSGLLSDHWNRIPPLHTPYNPPYLPEIAEAVFNPFEFATLFHLEIPASISPAPPTPANLTPLDPHRLAGDLLPLFASSCPSWTSFLPPDEVEAQFLLRWIGLWPLDGWVASIDGQPAGFILLQPDLSPLLKQLGGGRTLVQRVRLRRAVRRLARHGRLLYWTVAPDKRGLGAGRQLLHQAMVTASEWGWESISVGPLPRDSTAAAFLKATGAQALQRYTLYSFDSTERR